LAIRPPSCCLVSAFDLAGLRKEDLPLAMSTLTTLRSQGTCVALDSGGYESYWLRDADWSLQDSLHVAKVDAWDIAFTFDNSVEQCAIDESVSTACARTSALLESSPESLVVPILHGGPETFPTLVSRTARTLHSPMVAVPERELGDGVLARAACLRDIRRALSGLDYYCALHVLGTGDPISILMYSVCGADSFDGLEWSSSSLDFLTARVLHFHHWDFLRSQTASSHLKGIPYHVRAMLHNLLFYEKWMGSIQSAFAAGKASELAATWLPHDIVDQLTR